MKCFQIAALCLALAASSLAASTEKPVSAEAAKEDSKEVDGKIFPGYGGGIGLGSGLGVAPLGAGIGHVGVSPIGLGGVGGGFHNGGFASGQHAAGVNQGAGGFGYNQGHNNAKVFSDKQSFGNRESFGYSSNNGHAVGSGFGSQGAGFNQGGFQQGGAVGSTGYGTGLIG